MVSMIGREAATEANASAFSLESLGMCSSFQTGKLFKHCFTRDVFLHSRVSGLEFFVNLSDHQLGVTPNQESFGRHGGRQFEPD